MNKVTLDNVVDFNDELRRLSGTGLPLDLGFGRRNALLDEALDQLVKRLRIDVARGLSLDKAIATDPLMPRQYRVAFESWLRGDGSLAGLDGPSASANARQDLHSSVSASLIQPAIIIGLVYVAFIGLCTITAPKLEALHEQQFREPGIGLGLVLRLREWLPIWAVLVPASMLIVIVSFRYRAWRWKHRWLPGGWQYSQAIQRAHCAEHLAQLLEEGRPLAEALAIAGLEANDAANEIDVSAVNGRPTPMVSKDNRDVGIDPAIRTLPPIMRWAVGGNAAGDSMPVYLRAAASIYRQTAKLRANARQRWLPAIVVAFLGGIVVFAYCLSLFLPIVELLSDLAIAREV